ncbi:glycosyltransferase [Promicromonospora sp. Populi]|uniref:glycosyltransferase n=1 Tax=Promicromonospora sp. Populi TaxID=3239420 RepID=UPI0034E2E956
MTNGLHVCIFTDQHPQTLGGAQASVVLQRTFLERAGHTVTIVAPRNPAPGSPDPAVVELPALTLAQGQYSAVLAGAGLDARIDRALAARGPVSVVHLQGDFWGAWLGKRYAARHRLPVVLTTHTNVDASFRAVAGPVAELGLRAVSAWQRQVTGERTRRSGNGTGYDYLRALAAGVGSVVAPSGHFAARLRRAGLSVTAVIPTGVHDDDVAASTGPARPTPRQDDRVRLVWLGRFSAEKRPLELIEALAATDRHIEADLYGTGVLFDRAVRRVQALGLTDRVRLHGAVDHSRALRAIASADLLVQTSRGFETQGMTVYEALALGVPVVVCDPDIAAELGGAELGTAELTSAAEPGAEPWVWCADGPEPGSLARVLTDSARAVRSADGSPVPAALSTGLLQSAQTRRLLAVYADAMRSGADQGQGAGQSRPAALSARYSSASRGARSSGSASTTSAP